MPLDESDPGLQEKTVNTRIAFVALADGMQGKGWKGLGPGMHPYSIEGLLAIVPHEELDDMTAVEWLAGRAFDPVVALSVASNYDM